VIEKRDIFGFLVTGIGVTPSSGTIAVKVQETTLNNNSVGVSVAPTGSGFANVSIESSHLDNNVGGGIKIAGAANVAITDSSISLNSSNGLNAVSSGHNINVDLERVVISNNGLAGVQSNQSGGGAVIVTVGSSTLSNNGTAWSILNGATLLSFKNNQVTGPTGGTPGTASFQ